MYALALRIKTKECSETEDNVKYVVLFDIRIHSGEKTRIKLTYLNVSTYVLNCI